RQVTMLATTMVASSMGSQRVLSVGSGQVPPGGLSCQRPASARTDQVSTGVIPTARSVATDDAVRNPWRARRRAATTKSAAYPAETSSTPNAPSVDHRSKRNQPKAKSTAIAPTVYATMTPLNPLGASGPTVSAAALALP